jgi:hypothetical protein
MKRPHRFSIEIDYGFTSRIQYLFHNDNLEVRSRGRLQRLATPTIMQWSGFWRLCEFLDLWNWLPEYGECSARDGEYWKLDIAYDKTKQIHAVGNDRYPSLEDVKNCSTTQDRFSLLLHFIDMSFFTTRFDARDDFADYSER